MALSYCVPFQCDSELNLNRSLNTALQNSSCASLKKIEEVVENGHFHFLPFERNKLQWVDEKKEVISICFPAILDLDGQFTCLSSNFVSYLSFLFFFGEGNANEKGFKDVEFFF